MGQLSESEEHLLSRAKEKTQGLISTIGDLLDLSRIESGCTQQEPKPVQLEELLGNIVDFLGTRAKNKNQKLSLEAPDEPLPTIKADPLALESIFGNLITNAINYTQDGGTVTVQADTTGIHLRVRVTRHRLRHRRALPGQDFRPVFPGEERQNPLYHRYRPGAAHRQRAGRSLNGRISVESEPDKGTTFTVLLPVG